MGAGRAEAMRLRSVNVTSKDDLEMALREASSTVRLQQAARRWQAAKAARLQGRQSGAR